VFIVATSAKDDLVPEGGLYARVPIPAVRKLTYDGHKGAARVLTALCLHLGKGSLAVFPSYPTIALFACISENNIRKALDVLVCRGYISIEKRREGRKSKNYYSILPSAYLEKSVKKSKESLDPYQHWICSTCWEYVSPEETKFIHQKDYEGKDDRHWINEKCYDPFSSRRVYPALRGVLTQQEIYQAASRARRAELLSRGIDLHSF
jgi:DNA-binding PadR family transcriptional regulator